MSKDSGIESTTLNSLSSLRARLHECVFNENDIVFNENTTVVLHLHKVFVSFSYRFQPSTRKRLKTVKTNGNLLFSCQDNLNNLWLCCVVFRSLRFH